MRYSWSMRRLTCVAMPLLCVVCAISSPAEAEPQDDIATARALYNEGRFDEAVAAANAVWQESKGGAAAVILARARLERFRLAGDPADLAAARELLRAVETPALSPAERNDWELGIATALYLYGDFGPAAEILDRLLEANAIGGDDRDRLVDWWASATDQTAQRLDAERRARVYIRLADRLESERARNAESAAAAYWLVAAARGERDPERAWSLGVAAWIQTGATDSSRGRTDRRPALDRCWLRFSRRHRRPAGASTGVSQPRAECVPSDAEWRHSACGCSARLGDGLSST